MIWSESARLLIDPNWFWWLLLGSISCFVSIERSFNTVKATRKLWSNGSLLFMRGEQTLENFSQLLDGLHDLILIMENCLVPVALPGGSLQPTFRNNVGSKAIINKSKVKTWTSNSLDGRRRIIGSAAFLQWHEWDRKTISAPSRISVAIHSINLKRERNKKAFRAGNQIMETKSLLSRFHYDWWIIRTDWFDINKTSRPATVAHCPTNIASSKWDRGWLQFILSLAEARFYKLIKIPINSRVHSFCARQSHNWNKLISFRWSPFFLANSSVNESAEKTINQESPSLSLVIEFSSSGSAMCWVTSQRT